MIDILCEGGIVIKSVRAKTPRLCQGVIFYAF